MLKHVPRWLASCQTPKEIFVFWVDGATSFHHKRNRCRWLQVCRCGFLLCAVCPGRVKWPCYFFRLPQGQKMPHSRNGRSEKSEEWERSGLEAPWLFSPRPPESYPLIPELQKAMVCRELQLWQGQTENVLEQGRLVKKQLPLFTRAPTALPETSCPPMGQAEGTQASQPSQPTQLTESPPSNLYK